MYDITGNLKKGLTQLIVLKLLSEEDEMYGFKIIHTLTERGSEQYHLTEGALYPALHRLEKHGLVKSRTESSGARVLRRYYTITEEGRSQLENDLQKYHILTKDVTKILGTE